MLERGGKVRTKVLPNRRKKTLQSEIKDHVTVDSVLFSDRLQSYEGLIRDYSHSMIDHAVKYVDGNVHTNGIENYLEFAQARIEGNLCQRRAVPSFPLPRRTSISLQQSGNKTNKVTDGQRFDLALSQIAGKRLTFAEVTGKVGGASC